MRAPPLLLTAALLAATALAGCAGPGGDGGGDGYAPPEPAQAVCDPGQELQVLIAVDTARPTPDNMTQFSLSLANNRETAAPTPGNYTLQVVDGNGTVVAMGEGLRPRSDLPDEVPPQDSVYMDRDSLLIPGNAPPGEYRACAAAGDYTGVLEFTVYAPGDDAGADGGGGDGRDGAAL